VQTRSHELEIFHRGGPETRLYPYDASPTSDSGLLREPFCRTIAAVGVTSRGGRHYLVTRDEEAWVLFASEDAATVAWIDFAMELLAGLMALATGIALGRQGYRALRPLVDALWKDPGFRERLVRTGERATQKDALSLGWAVMALWLYVWRAHRRALLRTVWRALGEVIGPRTLLMALLRWAARLMGGGVTLALEIGALVLPLGRKLRGAA
jgi:hypothetical protein